MHWGYITTIVNLGIQQIGTKKYLTLWKENKWEVENCLFGISMSVRKKNRYKLTKLLAFQYRLDQFFLT
jgi:hypothetical protein